jgi:fructokinase
MFGAIEAGGTKFVCATGTGPGDLSISQIPTTSPKETLAAAIEYFQPYAGSLQALGIASFGPVDLDPASPTWGHITSTPKLAWRNCDLAGTLGRALGVPVGFDTDVNGAALGEARWGAARGFADFLYLTVGTGIGGGAMVGGRILHGFTHPEMGHIQIPHDTADPYPGGCPYHIGCLEGVACGPAIEARWGRAAGELPADHPAWALEARYLALGVANWMFTLSPRRVILGGGVMQQSQLFPLIEKELHRILNGYITVPPAFLAPPVLGQRAGVIGALVLAEEAWRGAGSSGLSGPAGPAATEPG